MFLGGCACLPWLWVVNVMYFWPMLRSGQAPDEIRTWVFRSIVGATFAFAALIAWVITFQLNWIQWGATDIMIVVPEDSLTQW
ncbi:unnamed protein product [Heterosigma akashiwo]